MKKCNEELISFSISAGLEPSYEISNVIIPLLDKEIEATEFK